MKFRKGAAFLSEVQYMRLFFHLMEQGEMSSTGVCSSHAVIGRVYTPTELSSAVDRWSDDRLKAGKSFLPIVKIKRGDHTVLSACGHGATKDDALAYIMDRMSRYRVYSRNRCHEALILHYNSINVDEKGGEEE